MVQFGVEKCQKEQKRRLKKGETAVFRKRNRAKTDVFSAVKLVNR
jgi:hypothetical protein